MLKRIRAESDWQLGAVEEDMAALDIATSLAEKGLITEEGFERVLAEGADSATWAGRFRRLTKDIVGE